MTSVASNGSSHRRMPAGFMGVPYSDTPVGPGFVLGMPFDTGTHRFRVGSRQGPAHIRACSELIRRFHTEFGDVDPLEVLELVDCGDVDLTPSQIESAFDRIETTLFQLLQARPGSVAYTLGGDGSVSLPQMRALGRLHPGLVAVHFDAHTDCVEPPSPGVHHSGTQFHYAAIEGCIDATRSFHLGIRGTSPFAGMVRHATDLGYRSLTTDDLLRRGVAEVMEEVGECTGDRPVYVCFDMDVLDPSCAPGVASPAWGGLLAREAIEAIRGLRGLRIVHVDLNTVSPAHDARGLTGSLAAALTYEMMAMQALSLKQA